MDDDTGTPEKPLFWVGSSKEDLCKFPDLVRRVMGFALFQAQLGGKHPDAKPLKGFGGAGVLEVVTDHDGSTYRGFVTRADNPFGYPSKDRSGRLDAVEEPHLGKLIQKCLGAQDN